LVSVFLMTIAGAQLHAEAGVAEAEVAFRMN
jgi:hypothetical protein